MTKDIDTGEIWYRERHSEERTSSIIIPHCKIVTFNGIGYDIPILRLAMAGASNVILKAASDDIIQHDFKPWDIDHKYGGVELSYIDHIDIMNVAPGKGSLKAYGGRLNSKKLQDLPIDPSAMISPEQRTQLKKYCENDLDTTIDLYRKLKPQIDLREKMSQEYDIDLRSKSDAQIAEAVIKKQLGGNVYRPEISPGYQVFYRPPEWVKFASEGLNKILSVITESPISLNDKGGVVMPKIFESMVITIGKMKYRLGVGGIHSCEKLIMHHGPLKDVDVTSYYPSIILNQGLYPAHLGPDFLNVYRKIVNRRLEAKSTGDTATAESLKIVINGSFGKFGNKWSILYSPNLLIQTTVTGQLAILMLIEILEGFGVEVVSANTDGVVFKPNNITSIIVQAWENITGFQTEETNYRALYSKDVNNYIAVKDHGGVKAKGLYATGGLSKNPTNTVCVEAVIAKLLWGVNIDEWIRDCRDFTKFLTCRKVTGGATHRGEYLGKNIRWYYAYGHEDSAINSVVNGKLVPKSQGAKPVMDIPDDFPDDINYKWYEFEARNILEDIAYDKTT